MYKRGDSWYSDFIYDGNRYTRAHGKISKSVAKEKDEKFKTEVREGKHDQKAKQIFFENFAEIYLEYAKTNKKQSTARRNETSIKMLKPHFNGKLLKDIHPFMVEQFKKKRRDDGAAPATVNRDIDCIKNMMSKAVDWKYLKYNPLGPVKKFKENNEKTWALSDNEEQTLLAECDKRSQKKKYLKNLVLFALNTGMRLDEILNLEQVRVHM